MTDEKTNDGNVLGDTAEVTFVSLRSHTLRGKVDTGADLCSLHADHWTIDPSKKTVQFSSKALTGNTNIITLPLQDQQAVKSANSGVTYRPVIALTVKINEKLLNNVLFNLSDRSGLEYPLLIGQNALEQGKFTINPTLENIESENKSVETPSDIEDNGREKIVEALKVLLTSNVSLQQIFAWYNESKLNDK